FIRFVRTLILVFTKVSVVVGMYYFLGAAAGCKGS
ncbi:MAG: hypothetical protein ACI974_001905, partial [Paraglaciecola sp.]